MIYYVEVSCNNGSHYTAQPFEFCSRLDAEEFLQKYLAEKHFLQPTNHSWGEIWKCGMVLSGYMMNGTCAKVTRYR